MAKQFAFYQTFRQCRTIERDEWVAAPTAGIVNTLSNQFLASAAFACEQHGSVVRGAGSR